MNMAKFNQLADVIGKHYGVTRERILQATTKFSERLSKDLERLKEYENTEKESIENEISK